MLTVRGLTVQYEGFRLGPLDLDLAPGDRVALVGANGAGKSTTLRAVSGRIEGYGGSARLEGLEVRDARIEVRARVGVLPERPLGLSWMRVEEHLSFLSRVYDGWDVDYAGNLCEALDVPTGTRLGQLSKGNRVKLGLVAAEAFRPNLLLLDEPTSGIDPMMRDHLLEVVGRHLPPGGERALVFSTHILEDIGPLAERVVVLREGRVVCDDTAEALVDAEGAPLADAIRRRLAHE